MERIAGPLVTIITLIAMCFGGFFYMEDRYAKADDVKKIEHKLTMMQLEELYRKALDNKYFWVDQNKKYPHDPEIHQKMSDAMDEVSNISDQIKRLKAAQDAVEQQQQQNQ
jgi:hypothetical protein